MSDYLPIIVTPDDAKNARLPDNYKAALKAIEQCEKIDECQDWADKYAALTNEARPRWFLYPVRRLREGIRKPGTACLQHRMRAPLRWTAEKSSHHGRSRYRAGAQANLRAMREDNPEVAVRQKDPQQQTVLQPEMCRQGPEGRLGVFVTDFASEVPVKRPSPPAVQNTFGRPPGEERTAC